MSRFYHHIRWRHPNKFREHVKVGKGFYSVPWRLLGQQVDVRATEQLVQVYHHGDLVKTHVRTERGRVTDYEDYPPEKIAFHRRTPAWCRQTAEQIGPATSQVINGLLEGSAQYQLRSAQAILAWRDKHDPARLEVACAKAVEAGDPAYRTIRNILAAGLEAADLPERPCGDDGAPAFLYGPDQLFGNVNHLPRRGEGAAS